jgi:hypothetical protein
MQSCAAAFIFGPRWTVYLFVGNIMSQAHETKVAGALGFNHADRRSNARGLAQLFWSRVGNEAFNGAGNWARATDNRVLQKNQPSTKQ